LTGQVSNPAMPLQAGSGATPELPQSHQMLDSAPVAAAVVPPATAAPNAAGDGQMHIGIRSDAFGSVEIHTVVQQSQVGITVHADRDISRWFSSEVAGLESALNKSHLNLTAVDFTAGSGAQAGHGFQQGEPRQGFANSRNGYDAAQGNGAEKESGSDSLSSTVSSLLKSELLAGPAVGRVSIHA
jgi:hypothetical protein